VAEVVPEPVRVHLHPALSAAAGDQLVDPGGGQRPPVVDAQRQLRAVRLAVPGAGPQVAVQAAGGLVADLDGPGGTALAGDPDLPGVQVQVSAGGSSGWYRIPAISDSPMPVARNTAMIAAARRCAKLPPRQVPSSCNSSTLVKTGTVPIVTVGARSRAIGSGSSSSAASHLKNCRRARNWMLA